MRDYDSDFKPISDLKDGALLCNKVAHPWKKGRSIINVLQHQIWRFCFAGILIFEKIHLYYLLLVLSIMCLIVCDYAVVLDYIEVFCDIFARLSGRL